MLTNRIRFVLVVAVVMILGGCSNKQLDFCRLLTTQDVGKAYPTVATAKMEEWYKKTNHPTWYCSWKDNGGQNLLSLSVSFATKNSPKDLATTFSGGSRVVEVSGVGTDAAMFIYKDKNNFSDRFTLLVRDSKWSLDIRGGIAGDETGEQFKNIKDLANKIISNLGTDKVFTRMKK